MEVVPHLELGGPTLVDHEMMIRCCQCCHIVVACTGNRDGKMKKKMPGQNKVQNRLDQSLTSAVANSFIQADTFNIHNTQ
jgi:hypothetical protein